MIDQILREESSLKYSNQDSHGYKPFESVDQSLSNSRNTCVHTIVSTDDLATTSVPHTPEDHNATQPERRRYSLQKYITRNFKQDVLLSTSQHVHLYNNPLGN
jgi:hypothetical protein